MEKIMKMRPIIPMHWNGPTSQPVQFPNLQDGIDRLHDEVGAGTNVSPAHKKGKTQNEEK
jgi:L-ascorbate metabolism protein UlaG (beta-lactamase superfamily)